MQLAGKNTRVVEYKEAYEASRVHRINFTAKSYGWVDADAKAKIKLSMGVHRNNNVINSSSLFPLH